MKNEIINPQSNRVERQDSTSFRLMMGVFFLLACLPATYWAFYKYGEYQHAANFVREMRADSGQFLTPNERKEREDRIKFQSSMADRYRLEMILSGAGGFVLFGISLLLFRSALKAHRGKQLPQFELIDWRTTPMPIERVEVRQKRLYDVLFAFIVVFLGGLNLLNLYQILTSDFDTTRTVVVRIVLLTIPGFLIVIAFSYLMIRAKRKSVRRFDASGITRGDGRRFPWSEFQGVITQIDVNQRTRNRYIWRIELACADGESAWIIPGRIKNIGEVMNFVNALPGSRLKIRA